MNNNKQVRVLAEDDHNVHLEVHAKANDVPATRVHTKTHELALSIKKVKPELFPAEPQAATFQPSGTKEILPIPERQGQPVAPSQTSNQPAMTR